MALWGTLYAVIWVVLLEFLLGTWPNPPPEVPYLHLVLGFALVLILYNSFVQLRRTRVPGRVKRVAKASFSLSILMVLLGLLLWFNVGNAWVIPAVNVTIYQVILFFHIVNALAIITQAAAVAIAFDMWEDHEFDKETEPGQVPAAPSP